MALELALSQALKYLSKACEHAKEDVEYCKNHLKAAQTTIIGLEKECDEILVESKYIDLNQPKEVTTLQKRIENYLTGEKLRPILEIALSGLDECLIALQENVERVLQWPWKKEIRQNAVDEFAAILQSLNNYLSNLKYDLSTSGASVSELLQIQNYLNDERPKDIIQQELADFVYEVQSSRNKDSLLENLSQIEKTIVHLFQAFR